MKARETIYARDTRERTATGTSEITPARGAELATAHDKQSFGSSIQKPDNAMTATAVVGSAAEDNTPSEREAPQRFAWWHPRSADLGRHKATAAPT